MNIGHSKLSFTTSLIIIWHQLSVIESSVNLAINKPTSQSSNYSNYISSNAVDGLNKQCFHFGIAHTQNSRYEWWQVDLEHVYEIKKIQIYYRVGYFDRLDGYSLDITESFDPLVTWQCFKDTDSAQPFTVTPWHICRGVGRYIRFSRERATGAVINLCELEVYGCPIGSYGDKSCNAKCSDQCVNTRCDPDNGTCDYIQCSSGQYLNGGICVSCSIGCQNGYCNPQNGECRDGCEPFVFGTFCNLTCARNCSITCDRYTGKCDGCKTGFYGDKCDKVCQWNCKTRDCNQNDGFCTSCPHAYKGITCTECADGFFGTECTQCSKGCINRKCNPNNGFCSCVNSFYGNKCNQSCPANCNNSRCNQTNGDCLNGCKSQSFIGKSCNECLYGKYGEHCDKECPSNCYSTICDRIDGICFGGCKNENMIGSKCEECSKGFYGALCNLTCDENCDKCDRYTGDCSSCKPGKESNGKCSRSQVGNEGLGLNENSSGPIIGGSVAAIVVVLIVVVILLFLNRKRNSQKDNKYENQITFGLQETDHSIKDYQKVKSDKTDNNIKESIASIENENDHANSPEIYMNFTLTEVPVSELSSYISKRTAEKEFEAEYDKLPKGSKHPTTVGKHPDNKIKNRFLTTFPYDHSRVVLKPITTQHSSDYINANYIDGVEVRHTYIATQGPKTNTLFDFWKMLWQEKSGKIVMLTNLIEKEKQKCEKYWPDEGHVKEFGSFKVFMTSEKEHSFFFERCLQLTNKKTKETRHILQFHFTTWPDHGTPDPVQLMLFHRQVKDAKTDLNGPPIVHCAAGIGRTGTFIALDTLHDYGDKTGRIDVFEYVMKMRKDRMNMIQTLDQYVVLHEALLESYQYMGRSLTRTNFIEVCSELDKKKPKNQTHVYKEFQNLSALRPVYGIESYDSALDKQNRRKSRNQNILAVEKYRPYLMSQHSSRTNFINAVMLPTFRKKCGYFATHYPLENTVVDFWCMVFDHDSSTIVLLDEISDKDNELHWYPADEMEMNVGSFQIKKVSGPHFNGQMSEISFTVFRQDDEKYVRMLMIRPWLTGRCVPADKKELLKLIEMTLASQITASSPVTIVCSDGARGCGLFCTVSNIILNLRLEQEIDIFHTVRQLQIRRPQFISDYDEYKSCYEMVKLFLESSNIYANV